MQRAVNGSRKEATLNTICHPVKKMIGNHLERVAEETGKIVK